MVEEDNKGGDKGGTGNDQTDYTKIAEEVKKLLDKPQVVDVEKLKAEISDALTAKIPAEVKVEDVVTKAMEAIQEKLPKEVDKEALKTEIETKVKESIKPADTVNVDDIVAKAVEAMKPTPPEKVKIKYDIKTAASLIMGKSLKDVQYKEEGDK